MAMASKTIGVKLDDELRTQVMNRCQTKGCKTSDYLKDLIKRDVGLDNTRPATQAADERPIAKTRLVIVDDGEAAGATPKNEGENDRPKVKIPSHVKKYKCKTCGKLHENKEFEGIPKGQCDNCGAFFTDRKSGKCPFCKPGEIGELEPEDVEKMELYKDENE